jgi:HK97 family phage portal protein
MPTDVLDRFRSFFRRKQADVPIPSDHPSMQRVIHDRDGVPYLNAPLLMAQQARAEVAALKAQLASKSADETPIINDGAGNRPSIRVTIAPSLGTPAWGGPSDYGSLANQYAANSDVYACVSLISGTAKQVRWNTEPGSSAKASVDLLMQSGGPQFIEAWCSSILIGGNSYIEIRRGRLEDPGIEVRLLSPDRVTAITNQTGEAVDTRYPKVTMWKVRDARGYPYAVAPEDMVHSKLFNPLDPIYGMAPLQAAMLDVTSQNQTADLLTRVLRAGFSPGWIEAAKESDWTDTQIAQLRERIRGSRERNETLFLQNAAWHDMGGGIKPSDSGLADYQSLTKRDIASVFHVPSQLIGDTQSQTYSNYIQARQALYMEAVIPLLKHFVEDWNRIIGAILKSDLAIDKNAFDQLVTTRAEAAERIVKLWTSGLLTQNEARESLAYDRAPDGGGDVFYAPANFLPLQGSEAEPMAEGGT